MEPQYSQNETWKKVRQLLLAEAYVRKVLEAGGTPDVGVLARRLHEECSDLTLPDAVDIVIKTVLAAMAGRAEEKRKPESRPAFDREEPAPLKINFD